MRVRVTGSGVRLALLALLLAGGVAGGCVGRGPSASRPEPVNAGLERIAEGEDPSSDVAVPDPTEALEPEPEDPWEQAALNLQSVLDETEQRAAGAQDSRVDAEGQAATAGSDGPGEGSPGAADDRASADGDEVAEAAGGGGPSAAGEEPSVESEGGESARGAPSGEEDAGASASARSLASALRGAMSAGRSPLASAVRLALVDAIEPGTLGADAALGSELAQRGLLAHEPEVVLATRALGRDLVESGEAARPVESMLEALERASGRLNEISPQFRVRAAALCTRVFGLASYEEFDKNAFLAGDPHRVIVYTEVERFGHRDLTASSEGRARTERRSQADRWAIEISQELTLYHEPEGDLQAWHRSRASVIETTRRKRDAMHLVNEITLPARLTVGRYTLKVTTRDETTGATDEAAIPIRVVADPTLATAQSRP